MTGLDRAAVNKNRGNIHAANTDHRAWHIFIAAADSHHTIHELRLADSLYRAAWMNSSPMPGHWNTVSVMMAKAINEPSCRPVMVITGTKVLRSA